jgi:flagellar export protein FliJ
MKRNRFRLETVLRVRRIQEDVELGRLGAAQRAAEAAHAEEEQCFDRYRVGVNVAVPALGVDAFLATRAQVERLGDGALVANALANAADEHVTERHADWSVAAQRVSGLERLEERHRDGHRAEVLADEVRDADEATIQRRFLAARDADRTDRTTATPTRHTTRRLVEIR